MYKKLGSSVEQKKKMRIEVALKRIHSHNNGSNGRQDRRVER